LHIGSKYYPTAFGSGTPGVDPCGYLVYYSWAGSLGTASFNVYTGLPQSVGDCLKLPTIAGVSGVAKITKPAATYKTAYTVTLGEATVGTAYSCYHFFTKTFETIVNVPASGSDTASELSMNYYLGSVINKKCTAPILMPPLVPAGQLTTSVPLMTSATQCGYLVEYTWTGVNGLITFQI